jgi:hypothetical protein
MRSIRSIRNKEKDIRIDREREREIDLIINKFIVIFYDLFFIEYKH